ncbi:MAG: hypothetical protein K9J37_02110 [Saprospiraceae bacterium]|nr:hypothetical protein [Saprospiraceae bacterium]MCF8248673.1 hypothetical protein [Saprospiraceae bacterium]MCF8278837.1 hypothetical protein [Bacteroidales bacterium]MCF8310637.1 hypothetical protein [Saprospiraceae bacterium]MCF8439196.1 hypothetical protein [Saprospiraceae bacterium]
MKQTLLGFSALLLFVFYSCNGGGAERASTEPKLLSSFSPMAVTDTMHFELPDSEEEAAQPTFDTIPNALFFASLDTAWLREIEHVADSAEATVGGLGRFVLNDNFDACLVEIRWFWYRHQSLLLYDKQRHAFTDRVTVAEWYGGDGGQVLTGSWLLDVDGDGQKNLVRREIEHWLLMQEDGEARDSTAEAATLLLLDNGQFVASPTANSADLVKRFPIKSRWE